MLVLKGSEFTLKKLWQDLESKAQSSRSIITLFGVFSLVNYPIFYFFWKSVSTEAFDSFYCRLAAIFLSLLLALNKFWPPKLVPFLPIYWYLTVMYCLPIYGTYSFLANHASTAWCINIILAFIWLVIILDWRSFSIILPLGVSIGYLAYITLNSTIYLDAENISLLLPNLVWLVILVFLFIREKEMIIQSRLEAMKAMGGTIAHEMRTPLAAIRSVGYNLNLIINKYKGKDGDPLLARKDFNYVERFAADLDLLVNRSNHNIDIMLANLLQNVDYMPLKTLSMQKCITDSIEHFPFAPGDEKLIHLNVQDNFSFNGNSDLMQPILFNLIQNSIYFIKQAGRGEIFIELQTGEKENTIIFKDTANGISPYALSQLFKPFYSNRREGTGMGLAFCKRAIEAMSGKINCQSVQGEHTTFYLRFPQIK